MMFECLLICFMSFMLLVRVFYLWSISYEDVFEILELIVVFFVIY